jgi:hypothetical protein
METKNSKTRSQLLREEALKVEEDLKNILLLLKKEKEEIT